MQSPLGIALTAVILTPSPAITGYGAAQPKNTHTKN